MVGATRFVSRCASWLSEAELEVFMAINRIPPPTGWDLQVLINRGSLDGRFTPQLSTRLRVEVVSCRPGHQGVQPSALAERKVSPTANRYSIVCATFEAGAPALGLASWVAGGYVSPDESASSDAYDWFNSKLLSCKIHLGNQSTIASLSSVLRFPNDVRRYVGWG